MRGQWRLERHTALGGSPASLSREGRYFRIYPDLPFSCRRRIGSRLDNTCRQGYQHGFGRRREWPWRRWHGGCPRIDRSWSASGAETKSARSRPPCISSQQDYEPTIEFREKCVRTRAGLWLIIGPRSAPEAISHSHLPTEAITCS